MLIFKLFIGIQASKQQLRTAFDIEGYHRRVARTKPYLSMLNKRYRLQWAKDHVFWTVQDWLRVIWTDEASFYIGAFRGRVWVTRNATEEFNDQCLIPRFQRHTHVMVWPAICADRLGPLVIWDKNWGNITSKAYSRTCILA